MEAAQQQATCATTAWLYHNDTNSNLTTSFRTPLMTRTQHAATSQEDGTESKMAQRSPLFQGGTRPSDAHAARSAGKALSQPGACRAWEMQPCASPGRPSGMGAAQQGHHAAVPWGTLRHGAPAHRS